MREYRGGQTDIGKFCEGAGLKGGSGFELIKVSGLAQVSGDGKESGRLLGDLEEFT